MILKIKNNKRIRKIILFIIFILFLAYACDVRLKTVVYIVESKKVNQPIKIALLTDLHSDWYGKEQGTLMLLEIMSIGARI